MKMLLGDDDYDNDDSNTQKCQSFSHLQKLIIITKARQKKKLTNNNHTNTFLSI